MKLEKFQDKITSIILAGGRGSRLGLFTENNPKPMIGICGLPLLHHLITSLHYQGIDNYLILSGYCNHKINDYFINYFNQNNNLIRNFQIIENKYGDLNKIRNIRILYTGLRTLTEKRIFQALKHVNTDFVLICYGDGIGNINISNIYGLLLEKQKKIIITGYRTNQKYGVLNVDNHNNFISILQQGKLESLINIGYILIETEFAQKYFSNNDVYFEECFLKNEYVIKNSSVYEHLGNWYAVDSIRDQEILENKLSENEFMPFYICL